MISGSALTGCNAKKSAALRGGDETSVVESHSVVETQKFCRRCSRAKFFRVFWRGAQLIPILLCVILRIERLAGLRFTCPECLSAYASTDNQTPRCWGNDRMLRTARRFETIARGPTNSAGCFGQKVSVPRPDSSVDWRSPPLMRGGMGVEVGVGVEDGDGVPTSL